MSASKEVTEFYLDGSNENEDVEIQPPTFPNRYISFFGYEKVRRTVDRKGKA